MPVTMSLGRRFLFDSMDLLMMFVRMTGDSSGEVPISPWKRVFGMRNDAGADPMRHASLPLGPVYTLL